MGTSLATVPSPERWFTDYCSISRWFIGHRSIPRKMIYWPLPSPDDSLATVPTPEGWFTDHWLHPQMIHWPLLHPQKNDLMATVLISPKCLATSERSSLFNVMYFCISLPYQHFWRMPVFHYWHPSNKECTVLLESFAWINAQMIFLACSCKLLKSVIYCQCQFAALFPVYMYKRQNKCTCAKTKTMLCETHPY